MSTGRRKWVIGSAWPYAHFIPHLGNLIGSVLSADVFARYLRLRGDDVVFVSGSDEHGTPIEVEAIKLGVKPRELTDRMHEIIKKLFELWEISFDNYTRTESDVHKKFVQEFYMKIYDRGFIFVKEDELPYCPRDNIYLPDRFVIGTCPFCGYDKARGDQCENCGELLEPKQLINPRCAVCGSEPIWRKTKHWYLDLTKLENEVRKYVESNDKFPENVKSMSLGMLKFGLKPRAITRDNKWGIPAPFPGAEDKTIYVWFEAVLGYISATIEYFMKKGEVDKWRDYWMSSDSRVVFFVGKDNIPFHAVIIPALLLASGDNYVMPYTVAATEYLLYEGKKFSKSQRIGIWIDEALKLMPPDYWRFILIMIRPETRDTSFMWSQAIELINSILNDVVGNYIHRVLTFIKNRLGGVTPEKIVSKDIDELYINEAKKIFNEVTQLYEEIKLREALEKTIDIARLGNKYLNERKPWEVVKVNIDEAKSILHTALHMVKMIAICMYPVMPRKMSQLWRMIGYEYDIDKVNWFDALKPVEPGLRLGDVKPLFRKISKDDVDKMMKELEKIRQEKWSRKYPWEQAYIPSKEEIDRMYEIW